MSVVQSANVYQRKGNLYIASLAKTEAGFWTQQPPYLALPADSPQMQIGAAVRWALRESRIDVPTPSVDQMDAKKPSENHVYKLAGAGGDRTFARGTRHVGVSLDGDSVTINPARTEERGKFAYLPAAAFSASAVTDEELAVAVQRGLRRCETFGET